MKYLNIRNEQPVSRIALAGVILSLILASFGIGTGEFAIMGLLPDVVQGISVDITDGGHLVSAYALGVVIGTPLAVIFVARLTRKTQLLLLLACTLIGNIATAFAPGYTSLWLARFAAGLPHGAFFGVASLLAASFVAPSDRGRAVGWIMLGITSATLVGNPLATYIGQHADWRVAYLSIATIELVAFLLLALVVRSNTQEAASNPLSELGALKNAQVWLTLGVGAIGFGGVFSVISYVTPALQATAAMPASAIPLVLFVFGIGMTIGNVVGGRAADKGVIATLVGAIAWCIFTMCAYSFLMHTTVGAYIGIFLVGTNMALVAPLQVRLMDVAGRAQTLAASLNHSALNLANALGPWLAGDAISRNYGWEATAYVGVVLGLVGASLLVTSIIIERRMGFPYAYDRHG